MGSGNGNVPLPTARLLPLGGAVPAALDPRVKPEGDGLCLGLAGGRRWREAPHPGPLPGGARATTVAVGVAVTPPPPHPSPIKGEGFCYEVR